jgi:hypothetical protein
MVFILFDVCTGRDQTSLERARLDPDTQCFIFEKNEELARHLYEQSFAIRDRFFVNHISDTELKNWFEDTKPPIKEITFFNCQSTQPQYVLECLGVYTRLIREGCARQTRELVSWLYSNNFEIYRIDGPSIFFRRTS